MASSVASYTPFPDLTGWRSSAAERGSTSSAVEVHDEHDDLSIDVLRGASQRLGIGDPGDLITAAWTIVLVREFDSMDFSQALTCLFVDPPSVPRGRHRRAHLHIPLGSPSSLHSKQSASTLYPPFTSVRDPTSKSDVFGDRIGANKGR